MSGIETGASRETQVNQATSELNTTLSNLVDATNELEKRLNSVIRPPSDAKTEDKPQCKYTVTLASDIKESDRLAYFVYARISDILTRLEV